MFPELFLSCDWGTSRFRLRLAEVEASRILAEITSDEGVAKIAAEHPPTVRPGAYRQTLLAGATALQEQSNRELSGLPVIVSGMASSSLGWRELPYARLPFALSGENAVWQELEPLRLNGAASRVWLISGAQSENDVVRGEETELIGAWQYARDAQVSRQALVILPGTHSKHLEACDEHLVSIRTYMTGELFDVVGRQSVLRHSLPHDGQELSTALTATSSLANEPALEQAFLAGVLAGSREPLSHALFHVRAQALLAGQSPTECAAYLSGTLIGGELMTLAQEATGDMPLVLCAAGELATRYQLALGVLPPQRSILHMPAVEVARLATRGQSMLLKSIHAAST